MNYENLNIKFKVYWQFKKYPHLKITKCKKIINCKNGKILKYHPKGYFIIDRYFKRNELKPMIEPIPKIEYCPFSNGTIRL